MDWERATELEAMWPSSHKGSAVWTLQHAGFDELTVKYHKPKNSEFWDFYPERKHNNYFFFCYLFVKCLLNYIFILSYVC